MLISSFHVIIIDHNVYCRGISLLLVLLCKFIYEKDSSSFPNSILLIIIESHMNGIHYRVKISIRLRYFKISKILSSLFGVKLSKVLFSVHNKTFTSNKMEIIYVGLSTFLQYIRNIFNQWFNINSIYYIRSCICHFNPKLFER